MKIITRVLLILIPILFVIFIIRIGFLGYSGGYYVLNWNEEHTVVTSIDVYKGDGFLFWDDLYPWFNSFPNFSDFFEEFGGYMADHWNTMNTMEIVDPASFFSAVGEFFQGLGSLFACIGYVISWPIQVIIWIAQVFFTPAA